MYETMTEALPVTLQPRTIECKEDEEIDILFLFVSVPVLSEFPTLTIPACTIAGEDFISHIFSVDRSRLGFSKVRLLARSRTFFCGVLIRARFRKFSCRLVCQHFCRLPILHLYCFQGRVA